MIQQVDHGLSYKDAASQESVSHEAGTSAATTARASVEKSAVTAAEKLTRLSPEKIAELVSKRIQYSERISTETAEGVVSAGIYTSNGKTLFVVPEDAFTEDNITGNVIATFASETGADVALTKSSSAEYSQAYDERFLVGLWDGMFCSTNLQRRRAKQGYELGRTAMFCLLVKNYFEQELRLGSEALCKDNFFFGNNPGEISGKTPVPFLTRSKIVAMYRDPKMGNLMYGIANYAASVIKLGYLTANERDKVISAHLIGVETVITSCYPSITIKRGKREVQTSRRPNPIRQSPLFLPEEMNIVSSITSVIFTDLASLASDWESAVFRHGFRTVKSWIMSSIRSRWETLQRFAHVTKIRLQQIRTITKQPNLKKAQVLKEHVSGFLKSLRDPAENLVSEVLHIAGNQPLAELVAYAYKKDIDPSQVRSFIYSRAVDAYTALFGPDMYSKVKTVKQSDIRDIEFQESLKGLLRIQNLMRNWNFNISNLSSIKNFRLFGRTEQIVSLFNNLRMELNALKKIDQRALTVACKLASQSTYRDAAEFFQRIVLQLKNDLPLIFNSIRSRLPNETDDGVKDLIRRFLSEFDATVRLEPVAGFNMEFSR